MQAFRKIDIFPKFDSRFEQEARDKTAFGAVLSVLALIVIVLLAVGEVRYFLSVETRHELYVDSTANDRKLIITINVTFHSTPCDLISIDAIDSFGEFQQDLDRHTTKSRVTKDGVFIAAADGIVNSGKEGTHTEMTDDKGNKITCGSCYGSELYQGECCNSCDDVRRSYERRQWTLDINDVSILQCAKERLAHAASRTHHEGCNIAAELLVKRVQGNIHFIPGRAFKHLGMHLHDIGSKELRGLNLTHTIHKLAFGKEYPGLIQPLDGQTRATVLPDTLEPKEKKAESHEGPRQSNAQLQMMMMQQQQDDTIGASIGGGKFQYFVKVVPTRFESLALSEVLETNQYSVTEHYSPVKTDPNFVPGLFFIYDLSPILVHIYEARPFTSFAHFLLELCAIIGGVFTVAGLVDATLYHGAKQVKRKMQIGKLS
jgi:hypothetical protein